MRYYIKNKDGEKFFFKRLVQWETPLSELRMGIGTIHYVNKDQYFIQVVLYGYPEPFQVFIMH